MCEDLFGWIDADLITCKDIVLAFAAMGTINQRIIDQLRPQRFAEKFETAEKSVLAAPDLQVSAVDRIIVDALKWQ